eukprot:PRCOL_00006811-RA
MRPSPFSYPVAALRMSAVFRAERKLCRKVYIPLDQSPGFNFVGLVIGPTGSHQKILERASGAKVAVRGHGGTFHSTPRRDGRPDGSGDELHVLVQADNDPTLTAACYMIEVLLAPPDGKAWRPGKYQQSPLLLELQELLDQGVRGKAALDKLVGADPGAVADNALGADRDPLAIPGAPGGLGGTLGVGGMVGSGGPFSSMGQLSNLSHASQAGGSASGKSPSASSAAEAMEQMALALSRSHSDATLNSDDGAALLKQQAHAAQHGAVPAQALHETPHSHALGGGIGPGGAVGGAGWDAPPPGFGNNLGNSRGSRSDSGSGGSSAGNLFALGVAQQTHQLHGGGHGQGVGVGAGAPAQHMHAPLGEGAMPPGMPGTNGAAGANGGGGGLSPAMSVWAGSREVLVDALQRGSHNEAMQAAARVVMFNDQLSSGVEKLRKQLGALGVSPCY